MPESLKTFFLSSEDETEQLAKQLGQSILLGVVIFLKGDLGAGKTTFVRGLLRSLQFSGKVKSPTFTLVKQYDFAWGVIYHFDLYRLAHPEEMDFIGIREYFTPESIVFVEWPENGQGYLPPPDLELSFQILPEGRKVALKAHSAKGQALLLDLK